MDELKDRYKMLPLSGRLLIMGLLGMLYPVSQYLLEADVLASSLETEQANVDTARNLFETASRNKAQLPKLEEKMAFTEEQLGKALESLPDEFHVEDVLQKVAAVAKETGVQLRAFKPGASIKHEDGVLYWEMPVETEVHGKYPQVAQFQDRIVHLESNVYIKSSSSTVDYGMGEVFGVALQQNVDERERARRARSGIGVRTAMRLAVYRSFTPEEEVQHQEEVRAREAALKASGKGGARPGGAPD